MVKEQNLEKPDRERKKIWISYNVLNNDQRVMRVLLAITHMHLADEGNTFFDRISMVDESWMQLLEPQLKQENAEWRTLSLKKKLA